jgi:MFS family permease
MSVWFTGSAASSELQVALALTDTQSGWLVTIVQLGFVVGTALAAVLNLADVISARRYFVVSALAAAVANAALLVSTGFETALLGRFATGFFLAGVYPPVLKMAATWFRSGRGVAIGTVVGALTLGKAFPYLVRGFDTGGLAVVVGVGSGAALVAALLVGAVYEDGPYPFTRRPFSWGLVKQAATHRETRLATLGYLGHMWELYAVWTAIGLFFFDYARTAGADRPETLAAFGAFAVIGIGSVGSVMAGRWADRWGREQVAGLMMVISGACALTVGWMLSAPLLLVAVVTLVWGFSVVADSAQFSALVTEVSPSHAVGTALTLQTSVGFLLTMVTVQGLPPLARLWGWGPAFSLLAIGPAVGILAMLRLRSVRSGS